MSLKSQLQEAPQIVVVCTGNICRSPMGEIVLGKRLADAGVEIPVVSAGVSSEEDGKGVYPPARRVLSESGYTIPQRRAHRVTDAELRESGLILAMTSGHARELKKRCLAAGVPLERIHLWREFCGLGVAPEGCFGPGGTLHNDAGASGHSNFYSYGNAQLDVPDPWFGGHEEFVATLNVVERGAEGIVEALR